jgi:16S rRNA C967 or C1407 C5-methylase (RsmB/RsmF family)/NOL1/NOP2/fmu family ribosome biogenesis protein
MKSDLGTEFPAFLEALNQPPPVSIRQNPAKQSTPTEVGVNLQFPNFPISQFPKIPWHPDGRYLPERPVFTLDPSFHAGAYYVQEASSMLLHEALRQTVGIGQPLRALDLCAAPGGKSTLLLSALGEGGFLLCNEVIQSRIAPLKMNLEKWGHANVAVSNHDPEDLARLAGFFDVVLVDAPCSGEGLFRKDEDATSHWSEASVEMCAARQQRILSAAVGLLRQGGVLLYSTCTFNALENENNVAWLTGQGFEGIRLNIPADWGVAEQKLGYQCYPHRVRGEGFYFACLRKTGESESPYIKPFVPKGWQRFPERQKGVFEEWVSQLADYEFYTRPEGTVVAVPKLLDEVFFTVGAVLKKRSIGLEIGELKNKDFVPSHTLAMAQMLHPDLPKVAMEKEQALHYLKKENLWEADWQRGWTLASYDGLPLGWMKVLDNRSNNYLPMEWRIRMAV